MTHDSRVEAAPSDAGEPTWLDAVASVDLMQDAQTDWDTAPTGCDPDCKVVAQPARVLFIGNSFVFTNDVAGHYRALVPGARVEDLSVAGYTLAQHAEDARSAGSELSRWLSSTSPEPSAQNSIVLQEQSQIGGFRPTTPERKTSIVAASALAELARAAGTKVVLYETWGYARGDAKNALEGYDTYAAMQDMLDEGYLGLASLLREQGADVTLAPVGGAFRTIFDDLARAGHDPLAADSDFVALYEPDGVHPSLRGAYLAACVLAGAIGRSDPRSFIDEPMLGSEVSRALRDACARTLADVAYHVPTIVRAEVRLSGSGAEGTLLGVAVKVSADGTRVVVGEQSAWPPDARSSAWFYTRGVAGFALEARLEGGPSFGSWLSLTSDASMAVIGPPITLYRRSGESWAAAAANEAAGLPSASRVLLSGDGSRAILAEAPGAPTTLAARVFLRTPSGWIEEGALHVPMASGLSVDAALDGRGERAVVSAHGDTNPRVFARGPLGWVEETLLRTPLGGVAISGDGTRVLVSREERKDEETTRIGHVVVFARDGQSWREQAALRGIDGKSFGASMALSDDGRRIVIGVPWEIPVAVGVSSGMARVYELVNGAYRYQLSLAPPIPYDGMGPDRMGWSVAISADGNTAVAGAPYRWTRDPVLNYVGGAHVFALPSRTF